MYKKKTSTVASEKIVFSIIICTLGDNLANLRRCMESIQGQAYSSFNVFIIDQGKIVEQGKHDQLKTNSEIYKKLLTMQGYHKTDSVFSTGGGG